jgi:hypothetical protein
LIEQASGAASARRSDDRRKLNTGGLTPRRSPRPSAVAHDDLVAFMRAGCRLESATGRYQYRMKAPRLPLVLLEDPGSATMPSP